jgi:hypothetical protein
MIRARVRVDNEDDGFTIVVWAESLQKAEQAAKARYPECAVKIAFPIEPECFLVGVPHPDLEATERLIGTIELS